VLLSNTTRCPARVQHTRAGFGHAAWTANRVPDRPFNCPRRYRPPPRSDCMGQIPTLRAYPGLGSLLWTACQCLTSRLTPA